MSALASLYCIYFPEIDHVWSFCGLRAWHSINVCSVNKSHFLSHNHYFIFTPPTFQMISPVIPIYIAKGANRLCRSRMISRLANLPSTCHPKPSLCPPSLLSFLLSFLPLFNNTLRSYYVPGTHTLVRPAARVGRHCSSCAVSWGSEVH